MATFTDHRPDSCPSDWVGGVNYSLTDDATGTRVLGAYSYTADRWVLPGERVYLNCESGTVADGAVVIFIGRTPQGHYAYELADGRRHLVVWQVRPSVIPAGA